MSTGSMQNSDVNYLLKDLLRSIIGDITKDNFQNFVSNSWETGQFLHRVDEAYHPFLHFLNT